MEVDLGCDDVEGSGFCEVGTNDGASVQTDVYVGDLTSRAIRSSRKAREKKDHLLSFPSDPRAEYGSVGLIQTKTRDSFSGMARREP